MDAGIPFDDFEGEGELLHFAHANGYPPRAYLSLLSKLACRYSAVAMRMRPLWSNANPEDFLDWAPLSDDLAAFLDQISSNSVIGVGHSMGAIATLRLAIKQPDRFSKLILIDPVLFPPWMIRSWNLLTRIGLLDNIHPLISRTKRRREYFSSEQSMFDNYREKNVFRYINDTNLLAYVRSAAKPTSDGEITLAYPKRWEVKIYQTGLLRDMDIWRNLSNLKPDVLLIRGAETDTFWTSTARRFKNRKGNTQIISVPGSTHLIPLEKPGLVSDAIINFLTQ